MRAFYFHEAALFFEIYNIVLRHLEELVKKPRKKIFRNLGSQIL